MESPGRFNRLMSELKGVGPQFFREPRFYVARLDVPATRESLVAKLMAAIDDVHNRAQNNKDGEATTRNMRYLHTEVAGPRVFDPNKVRIPHQQKSEWRCERS